MDDLLIHSQTDFITVSLGGKEYNLSSPCGIIQGQKYQLVEVSELDQHEANLRRELNITKSEGY